MDEWKQIPTQLSEVADVFVGFPFRSETFTTEGVKLLRGDNISQGYIDWTDAQKLAPELATDFADYELCEGDIVLAMDRPWVGAGLKFASVRGQDSGALLVQRTARLRGSEAARTEFLRYVIASPAYSKYIKSVTTGSLVPHISKQQIQDFRFFLPSIDDQQKIATVLSTIDAKIDLNNRINAELEALAKTIYDYWFVQFDFPDAQGRPYKSSGGKMVWNAALKREIPEGWEDVALKNLVDCNARSYGTNNLPNKVAYLDTGSLTANCLLHLERLDTNKDEVPSRARRIVANGDVLYSTVRPNQNHHGIIKASIENLVASTGFAVLTCTDKHINSDFIYMSIRSDDVAAKMQRIAESSRSSYPSIAPDDLLGIRFALPKDRSQALTPCRLFDQTFQQVWANQEQNRELTRLRDWLLPLLMNGQVRVA